MTCDCRRGESELKYGIITNNCKETGQDINCKPWGKGRDVQVLDITPPPPHIKRWAYASWWICMYITNISEIVKLITYLKKNTAFDINNGDWIKQFFKN